MMVPLPRGIYVDIDAIHSAVQPHQDPHGRHVDILSHAALFAPAKGGYDGGIGALGGGIVAHRCAVLLWGTVLFAGNLHDPGQGLDHQIVAGLFAVRAFLTKGSDGAINQARIARRGGFIVQLPVRHSSRAAVLDHHIRLLHQGPGGFQVLRTLKVQHKRLFSAVEPTVGQADALHHRRHGAQGIACGGLDFEHRGAVISHHSAGTGTSHCGSEI